MTTGGHGNSSVSSKRGSKKWVYHKKKDYEALDIDEQKINERVGGVANSGASFIGWD